MSRALPAGGHLLFSTFGTPQRTIYIRSRFLRAVEGAATQKTQDSTALTGCKEKWTVANIACDLLYYTTPCGIRPFSPTTAGVLASGFSPLHTSHTATAIPATSVANLFTDTRRSHQFSGSKSPSFAPETFTCVCVGKICVNRYRDLRV